MPTIADVLANVPIRPNGHDAAIIRQNFSQIKYMLEQLAGVTVSASSNDDLEYMDWIGL